MATAERWQFGEPHEAQAKVLMSPHRFVYYRGGLGAGKTWTGCQWAAANVLLHSAGATGVIISPTYSMLDDVIRPQIEELWPRQVVATWHGTERSYTWSNGSKVLLRSAERPGRLRGIQVAWAWLDEPAEMKAEIWTTITGRIRSKTRWIHQILLTGTPSGYNWVHDAFGNPGEKLEDGVHVVKASTEQNADNLPEGYIDSLRGLYSARLAAQELSGEVVHLEGQVFDYKPGQHVVDCNWQQDVETYAGLDFGYRSPAVVFFRRHPERDAWVAFDELMPNDTTTEQLADRILAKRYNLTEVWCDPAGKQATTAGRTDVDVLRRAGIPARYRTSSKVRRIAFGLEVMRAAMDPADGSPPRFLVHERLTKGSKRGLHRSLLSYRFKGNTEAPEKDNVHDHACDAARYFWANMDGVSRRTVAHEQQQQPVARRYQERRL
jgi:hypothetical protein